MDENTKFLMHRIDRLEERLMSKIEDLQGFRNKVVGISGLVSIVVTALIEIVNKKFF